MEGEGGGEGGAARDGMVVARVQARVEPRAGLRMNPQREGGAAAGGDT